MVNANQCAKWKGFNTEAVQRTDERRRVCLSVINKGGRAGERGESTGRSVTYNDVCR